MLPKVVQVLPTKDFKVYVYFVDGKIKLYDVKPLIERGGVFGQIENSRNFTSKCTVINGTLAWDIGGKYDKYNCLDIDPVTVYETGIDVKDPLDDGASL